MNALKNKVQLIGHLGQNPEIKTFDGGKKLAKFNMATNDSYQNQKGEKVDETQWHTVTAWGKTADVIEKYLSKGSEVMIEGRLTHREYTDANGIKKYFTEVQLNELLLLDKKAAVS